MLQFRCRTILFVGLSAAMAVLGGACQSLTDYANQMKSQPDMPSVNDATASSLDVGAMHSFKLPPKDANAFGVGAVLPLSGPRAAAGEAMRHGLELASDEINAAGGFNGRRIQIDILDSANDVETGTAAIGALRDRGEGILLIGDGPLAIAQEKTLANCPQIVGFLCDYVAALHATPRNGVRIYLNGDQEARSIENYVETEELQYAAIVNINDLAGLSDKQYLQYQFSGNHAIHTVDEQYVGSENDFDLLAKAMLSTKHGALILIGNGPEYSKIYNAFESSGWQGRVFGYADVAGLAGISGSGNLAAAAAYPLPIFAGNPRASETGRAFADAYHAKFGEDPLLPAAYAYDTLRALTAAAAQGASSAPAKIRAAFLGMKSYVGAVGRYDIKEDGDTEMPLQLLHADGSAAPPAVAPAVPPTDFQTFNITAPDLSPSPRK